MQVQYTKTMLLNKPTRGAWTLMVGAKFLPNVTATCDVCMS